MQVTIGTVLVGMDDSPLKDKIPSGQKNLMGGDIMIDGPEITLRAVSMTALTGVYEDERNLSGDEKVKRWMLAVKLKRAGDSVDLVSEEIVLIKKLIGKAYGPIVCGQSWQLLEPTVQQ